MVFSSTVFLFLFLPIVLLLYFNPLCKSRKYRNYVLLIFSLLFYAWGEPVFVFVMICFIIFDWLIALLMEQASKQTVRKLCVLLAITAHMIVFFIYKYLTFTCENINLLLKKDVFSVSIALPIGISFFTFQMLSYVLDVYWKKAQAQKKLTHVALYIAMFPQLVAGPIVRYKTVAAEIESRQENRKDFVEGMARFIVGLAKKVLLANYFGILTDNIFTLFETSFISIALAWLGAIAYTLQIYFDFSAYSDMAIGLGRVFGFHFAENFNYPYIASSVTEFWRRWHISLSSWFRDYIYIPLGGNRVGKVRHIINLFIVWLLTGIWHGADWTYIAWGLLYFCVLVLEKKTDFTKKLGWFSHIYTMLVVILAWVLFRSNSITQAIAYIGCMFGVNAKGALDSIFIEYINQGKWLLIMGIVTAIPYYKRITQRLLRKESVYNAAKAAWLLVMFLFTMACMVKSTYNPFIYFNF